LDNTDSQTLEQILASNSSAGNSLISDVLDPVSNQDVATKAYVDAKYLNSFSEKTNANGVVIGSKSLNATIGDNFNIDSYGLFVIDTPANNEPDITLDKLNSDYNGKVIKITEANDENPIISTFDSSDKESVYDGVTYQKLFGKSILFDGTFESLKYESVNFIWIWTGDVSTGSGKWIPMR